MKVRILEPAKGDLIDGIHFYEDQETRKKNRSSSFLRGNNLKLQ